jgi:hypothetical protein
MISLRKVIRFKVGEVYRGVGKFRNIKYMFIKKNKNVCICERSDGYFEVVPIKYVKGGAVFFGDVKAVFKEKESYPPNSNWKGIVVSTKDRAYEIFDLIKINHSYPYS